MSDHQLVNRPDWKRFVWLAWFTGARLHVLRRVPSEIPFYNALGTAVLILSTLAGVSFCVALGSVLDTDPRDLWPAGLVWAFFIANLERLVLGMPMARHRVLVVLAMFLSRALVTVVIALMLAEPIGQLIFDSEIQSQLQKEAQAETHASVTKTENFYGPKIAAAQREINQIFGGQRKLEAKQNRYRFLAECERGEVSCSTTRRLGCGPYCRRYARLADTATAELRKRIPRDRERIQELTRIIDRLTSQAVGEEEKNRKAIRERTGLIARAEALSAVQSEHAVAAQYVWFIRIALIFFDLLPLLIKTIRSFVVNSAYEGLCAAEAEAEGLDAHRERQQVWVEKEAVSRRARMADDVDRVSVDLETEHRISQEEERWGAAGSWDASTARRPISGLSLTQFVTGMKKYENKAVEVAAGLTRGAWIALALTAAVAVFTHVYVAEVGDLRGLWLPTVALAVLGSLAVFTRGFRKAPSWALHAIFASILIGLALPVLIVAINV